MPRFSPEYPFVQEIADIRRKYEMEIEEGIAKETLKVQYSMEHNYYICYRKILRQTVFPFSLILIVNICREKMP